MSKRVDHPPRVREAIDELMCKKDARGKRMSEYIISDEQIASERRQAYEAGSRNRMVWTARAYHGEEIVRCKDCELEMNGYCSRPDEWNDDLWFPIEPDGFCAWGERSEDE